MRVLSGDRGDDAYSDESEEDYMEPVVTPAGHIAFNIHLVPSLIKGVFKKNVCGSSSIDCDDQCLVVLLLVILSLKKLVILCGGEMKTVLHVHYTT